jgi:type IV pilus assembly protein PilM
LAKIIKGAWKKFGIKEKSVGIILPEFSTLVKSFKLPKLKLSEVNEAVRWQAQEFLPTNLDDNVLDWKIVKKEKDSLEISVVSVYKDILMGFVDSLVLGGLFLWLLRIHLSAW